MKQPCPYTDTLWSINIIFHPEEFLHMTLPPPPLLPYINVHWATSISVSCTMLSQGPTTTTTTHQCPLDHLHVCVLYNCPMLSQGPTTTTTIHQHPQTTSIFVSHAMFSQCPTTTTTIHQHPPDHLHICVSYNAFTRPHDHHYHSSMYTGPPPCLRLIQSSHKAPQPPLLHIHQRPLDHLHICVLYNDPTRPPNGSHGP